MTPMKMLKNTRQTFKKQNSLFFDYSIYHRPPGPQHIEQADFTELFSAKTFGVAFSFAYYSSTNEVEVCLKPNLANTKHNHTQRLTLSEFREVLNDLVKQSGLTLSPTELMNRLNERIFSSNVSITAQNASIEAHVMNYLNEKDTNNQGQKKRDELIQAQNHHAKASEDYQSYVKSLPQSEEIDKLQKRLQDLLNERHALSSQSEQFKELAISEKELKKAKKQINTLLSPLKNEIQSFSIKNFPEINKQNNYVIHTEDALFFDEPACVRFLDAERSELVERELIQTLFLAICQKHIGLNVKDKNGNPLLVSQSFSRINNYVPDIVKKLNGMNVDTIFKSVMTIAYYDETRNAILYGKVYPELLALIKPDLSSKPKDGAFIQYYKSGETIKLTLYAFAKEITQEYLAKPETEAAKRELSQLLFLDMYLMNKKVLLEKAVVIHPNWQDLAHCREEIKKVLNKSMDEDELLKYIRMVTKNIYMTDEEFTEVFTTLSIQLTCEEGKQINNDIIKLPTDTKNKSEMNTITFNEEVCQKLLQKPLSEVSIREFSQAYFLYEYQKRYGKEVSFPGYDNPIAMKLGKMEKYIAQVYEKINGFVSDEQFDNAINILLRNFKLTAQDDEQANLDMQKQIMYPVKKSLGLKTPSLFKHLL